MAETSDQKIHEKPGFLVKMSEGPQRNVAVQSRKQQIDPQEGEQQQGETDDGQHCGLATTPADGQPAMQQCRVQKPGDQGPGLLGDPSSNMPPRRGRPQIALLMVYQVHQGKAWFAEQ